MKRASSQKHFKTADEAKGFLGRNFSSVTMTAYEGGAFQASLTEAFACSSPPSSLTGLAHQRVMRLHRLQGAGRTPDQALLTLANRIEQAHAVLYPVVVPGQEAQPNTSNDYAKIGSSSPLHDHTSPHMLHFAVQTYRRGEAMITIDEDPLGDLFHSHLVPMPEHNSGR